MLVARPYFQTTLFGVQEADLHPKMASMTEIAAQYFSTLNPLAEKIYQDIEETKTAYEGVWHTLTEREKTEVINDTLIKPDISLKYTALDMLNFDINDPPFFRKSDLMSFFGRQHASRIVQDDNTSYKDEHSAPFLFQTKSQLNLCVLSDTRYKEEERPEAAPMSQLVLSHSKVVSELKNALRSHALKTVDSPNHKSAASPPSQGFISKMISKKNKGRAEERERLVSPEPTPVIVSTDRDTFASVLSPRSLPKNDWCQESRSLLDRDSTDESLETLSEDTQKELPITGLDFLDNW